MGASGCPRTCFTPSGWTRHTSSDRGARVHGHRSGRHPHPLRLPRRRARWRGWPSGCATPTSRCTRCTRRCERRGEVRFRRRRARRARAVDEVKAALDVARADPVRVPGAAPRRAGGRAPRQRQPAGRGPAQPRGDCRGRRAAWACDVAVEVIPNPLSTPGGARAAHRGRHRRARPRHLPRLRPRAPDGRPGRQHRGAVRAIW